MTAAPTVLIVDDERSNRAVAGRVLTGAGYRVTAVATAAEATRAIDVYGPFELYVIDVRMPRPVRHRAHRQHSAFTQPDGRILYFPPGLPTAAVALRDRADSRS